MGVSKQHYGLQRDVRPSVFSVAALKISIAATEFSIAATEIAFRAAKNPFLRGIFYIFTLGAAWSKNIYTGPACSNKPAR